MPLIQYGDFEGVMLKIAAHEGWTFCDGDEEIAPEAVFNEETYGPAILKVGGEELRAHGIDANLALAFQTAPDSVLGVSVALDPDQNSFVAALWRVCMSAHVITSLPKIGEAFDLSMLRLVFGPQPAPGTA